MPNDQDRSRLVEFELGDFRRSGKLSKLRTRRLLNQDSPPPSLNAIDFGRLGAELGATAFVTAGRKLKASQRRHLNYG